MIVTNEDNIIKNASSRTQTHGTLHAHVETGLHSKTIIFLTFLAVSRQYRDAYKLLVFHVNLHLVHKTIKTYL